MICNPLDSPITRKIKLPLYYPGLSTVAHLREKEGKMQSIPISRNYSIDVTVKIAAHSYTRLVIE
jgi:hypothetical protein